MELSLLEGVYDRPMERWPATELPRQQIPAADIPGIPVEESALLPGLKLPGF